uniref:Protein kinase domain-containing protein n=1 Tax=Elaeophora elaphi TaxID=1147741 RepID=A0A0R3S1B6_9BILA
MFVKLPEREQRRKKIVVDLEDYHKFEKIGQGGYGTVFEAISKETGKPIAIKVIQANYEEQQQLCVKLQHSVNYNMQTLLNAFLYFNNKKLEMIVFEEDITYLIFERLDMDLRQYIDLIPDNKLMDKIEVKEFLHQILHGVCFCHQRGIMHRDLKPENSLVKGGSVVIKIAHFGLARAINIPMRAYIHEVVTLSYRAQKYYLILGVIHMGLIFGMLDAYLLKWRQNSHFLSILSLPTEETWPGITKVPCYRMYPHCKNPKLEKVIGEYMDCDDLRILKAMLTYNPAQRISTKELIQHAYFEDINKKKKRKVMIAIDLLASRK